MTSSDIFEGIAALSQLGMALAVSFGVLVAYRQILANRVDQLELKKFEIADQIIELTFELVDRLDEVRTPAELVSLSSTDDQVGYVNARLEHFQQTNAIVKSIARLNVRQLAIIQSDELTKAIDQLFLIRKEVFRALLTVRRGHTRQTQSERFADAFHKAEDIMYGAGDPNDEIHQRQQAAVEMIQSQLAQSMRIGL